MRLWHRLAGAVKDQNSVWVAQLSRRNPELEASVIKATSHDQHRIDFKNVQHIFQRVRTSPLSIKPFVWALAMRMHKTRSWVVALKGLMLMHGVYYCDLAIIQKMGRLPFDLTNFTDEHENSDKAGAYNAFVRSYFAYLDQKSAFSSVKFKKRRKQGNKTEDTLMEELEKLQAMQDLVDMLLQIKPEHSNSHKGLILEAMDCVVVELLDVYTKLCKGVARALLRIYDVGGKKEASVGLEVLQKAAIQSGQLREYFDFCREIGVLNASQCPKMERFPEGHMQDLERIINGADENENMRGDSEEDNKAIVAYANAMACNRKDDHNMKTVITEKWEVFDDEMVFDDRAKVTFSTNPFEESYYIVPYQCQQVHDQVLPDLISFSHDD